VILKKEGGNKRKNPRKACRNRSRLLGKWGGPKPRFQEREKAKDGQKERTDLGLQIRKKGALEPNACHKDLQERKEKMDESPTIGA